MEKKQPELKGVIQTASESRQKLGDISLWPNESDNPKAPKYIGEMRTSHGTRYRVSLWSFEQRRGQKPLTQFMSNRSGSAITSSTPSLMIL